MRFLIMFIGCCFLSFSWSKINAQISLGTNLRYPNQVVDLNESDWEDIKNARVLFALRSCDTSKADAIRKMLREVWTFNEIILVDDKDLSSYDFSDKLKYAILSIDFYDKVVQGNVSEFNNTHYMLRLKMIGKDIAYRKRALSVKGRSGIQPRQEIREFGRIELYPDSEVILHKDEYHLKADFPIHRSYVNTIANFYNWEVGYLKNALQELNRMLNNRTQSALLRKDAQRNEVKQLMTETLFVPDHLLNKFNAVSYSEAACHDHSNLMSKYDFPYEFISSKDLSDKILKANEPFYYLNYVKSSTIKIFSIVNGLTGEIILHEHASGYNIKNSDINLINNWVANSVKEKKKKAKRMKEKLSENVEKK